MTTAGGAALGQTAAASEVGAQSIRQAIAANSGAQNQICQAITPILHADPASAAVVIESAQAQPDLLEPLCECVSQAQRALKSTDPQGAAVVASAVASASPAFQACYAVALAPGEGGPGPVNQAATAAPGGSGGGGGAAPFSPVGFAGPGGFGGGPTSPN